MGTGQGVSLFQGTRHDTSLHLTGPTAGLIWTSRSSPGDQIAAGWASPLSRARLGQVQILPSLGTAACPPPSPANLILSGLYFRSDEKDLEGSTYNLRPRAAGFHAAPGRRPLLMVLFPGTWVQKAQG